MGALLALASALCYGVADYAGGLLSRRANPAAIALTGQASGFVLALLVAPFVPSPGVTLADLGWGALSGVGTGIGMAFLYKGLSRGAMSVVVPVSAVGGVALPVVIGVALLGDRPTLLAWSGIAVALPALWLVSRKRGAGTDPAAVPDALLASAGIALQYLALAQAAPSSGIWAIVAGRLAASLTILPMARSAERPSPRIGAAAALNGGIAALALVCYLLSARYQIVSIAVVLSSLYPAIPVLLGVTALRERLTWPQAVGLLGAGAAIGLLTLS